MCRCCDGICLVLTCGWLFLILLFKIQINSVVKGKILIKLTLPLQRHPRQCLQHFSQDGKTVFTRHSHAEVLPKNTQQSLLLRGFVAVDQILRKPVMLLKRILLASFFLMPSISLSEVSILALGDSLTQGYGLAQKEGFVPQLNNWLSDHGHEVNIINGGVSGDTSAGGLERVAWALQADVDILIVALGGNDLLRGIDPSSTRTNLDKILAIGAEKGVRLFLIGMTAPNNFGPEYKEEFDSIYPELAQKYSATLVDRFMAPLLDKLDAGERLEPYLQQDMLHPNAVGVDLIVDHVGPILQTVVRTVAEAN